MNFYLFNFLFATHMIDLLACFCFLSIPLHFQQSLSNWWFFFKPCSTHPLFRLAGHHQHPSPPPDVCDGRRHLCPAGAAAEPPFPTCRSRHSDATVLSPGCPAHLFLFLAFSLNAIVFNCRRFSKIWARDFCLQLVGNYFWSLKAFFSPGFPII